MRRPLLFTLLLGLLAPGAVSAHSLYIQAGRQHVSKGKGSPLFFCYGHHIPVDDAVRRKKLEYVRVTAPDGTAEDIPLRDEKSLHSYVVEYEKPGTYALSAATTPGSFTMWKDKKGRRRHSIKPMSAVKDKASEILSSLRSSQWTKTYVVCGEPSQKFPAVIGMPLELVPARDVSGLKQGETLDFQVYRNGEPYTGEGFFDATYNGFSTEAEDNYIPKTAVKGGKFSLPLDVTGRWFVRFYTKTDPPAEWRDDCLKEKRTATLVFEIPNARKRPKADGR